jgi:hypothetical protein
MEELQTVRFITWLPFFFFVLSFATLFHFEQAEALKMHARNHQEMSSTQQISANIIFENMQHLD